MSEPLLNGPFVRTTVANFFFFLNFASFFLLPLYVKSLGGSEAVVGATMGTSGLASMLFLPVVAVTIDRWGARRFLLAGTAGMTIASLSFLTIDRIGPALFALRVLQGVSFAAAFTAATTFAAELAPRARRAQALGIFGLSTLLTHAIAPGVGEEIIRRGGFRPLFLLTAGFTVVVGVLAFGLPRRRPGHGAHGTPPAPAVDRLQWVVAATMTLAGMGFGSVITFVPTFVRGAGLGRVGVFFAAYTATAILTRVVGAGLSDSLGRRRVILPTLLGLATSIAILSTARSVPVLIFAGAVFGCAQGISYPTLHAFIVDLAPEAHVGRAQALFNGAFNLGVTSSSFLFGVVAERWGYRSMFVAASLAPVLAWGLFFALARPGGGETLENRALG
jgi:MFS family permease